MTIKENKKNHLQTMFDLGEVGDRLAVKKDNSYYSRTANKIINLIPTEIGTLKIMKQLTERFIRGTIDETFLQVMKNKHGFYFAITTKNIYVLNQSLQQSFVVAIPNIAKYGAMIIGNFLCIPTVSGRVDFEFNDIGALAQNNNFRTAIRKPLKNFNKVVVDIYQVRKHKINFSDGTAQYPLRAYKINTTEFQEFTNSSNYLRFKYDTHLNLERIYNPHQQGLQEMEDTLPGLVENRYYISIQPLETLNGGSFYLGNQKITFKDKVTDASGVWYKGITPQTGASPIGQTGLLSYGSMFETFDTTFNVMTEYQNRFVVSDGEYIFFSKTGDYNYFLNGLTTDGAFYIKLSDIDNSSVRVLRMHASKGIYIVTDKGIYIVGYNQLITGSNVNAQLITKENCTGASEMIGDILYYVNEEKVLKAIHNTTALQGYVDFTSFAVDKFNEQQEVESISVYEVYNKKYLLVHYVNKYTGEKTSYLINSVDVNVYSRVEVECPENMLTVGNIGFSLTQENGLRVFQQSKINVDKATIVLNSPPTYRGDVGTLIADSYSQYKSLNIKFIDDSNDSIEYLEVNRILSNALGESSQGVYSLYNFNLSGIDFLQKIKIDIYTKINENNFEIQGTDLVYITNMI